MAKIRVLIVDDHAIVRAGLRMLINPQPDMEVVGEVADGHEALRQAREANPDVLTLDLTMPGGGGLKTLEGLRQACPQTRVLVLTMHEDPSYLRAVLAAGGLGYVAKSAVDGELLAAIRSVAQGRTFVTINLSDSETQQVLGDRAIRTASAPRAPLQLSPREQEVLKLLAQGYTNQEVGTRLCLSVKTIETYRARIVDKLGLRTLDRPHPLRLGDGSPQPGPILSRLAIGAASFVRVFLTNRLDTGITLTGAARFSLMSSLISSNYPDTAGCPRLGNIAIFPKQQGKRPTANRQWDPTNVMEGPVADVMKTWPCADFSFIRDLLRILFWCKPVFAGIEPILPTFLGTSPRRP